MKLSDAIINIVGNSLVFLLFVAWVALLYKGAILIWGFIV